MHQTAQFLCGAGVGPWLCGFVHFFGQHHGGAGDELGANLVNFFKPNGHAATGGEGLDAKALAVYPDAVPGFAAQPVHRVGIVQGIGYAAVFLEIQPAGYFVFHKIDALGGAQVVERLLVARELTGCAGVGILELERTFFLKKHEGLALFVHSNQMGRQPLVVQRGLPFVGLGQMRRGQGAADAKGQQQPTRQALAQTAKHTRSHRAEHTMRQHPTGRGTRGGGCLSAQGPPIPHG